ncbi:MAG: DUF1788 domain-containing protein [Propionibacteriaceae bacterium]|nr:DUF1788 domain-containing protein [Propionibacteriaceae bacterium]
MSGRYLSHEEKHILAVLGSERFLKMEGLGNEVPFFIWAYPPEWELDIDAAATRIGKSLRTNRGLDVLTIDLYDLSISLLERRGVLDRLIELEPTRSREDFRRDLQRMLDPEKHVVPAIRERIAAQPGYAILFLTGIGQVFPFIRSHNVLNNLQSVASSRPMLMFFPGEYRQSPTLGSALVLFDRLPDDQYYRAKNILEQEPA